MIRPVTASARCLTALAALAAFCGVPPVHAAGLAVLEETGTSRAAADGKSYPVLRPARVSNAMRLVQTQLEDPFGAFVLRLDALAREIGRAHDAGRGNDHESFLLISQEDGGFARLGFWLAAEGAGEPVLCECHYVVMTADEASLADGRFLEVFGHELGHVMLRRLRGAWPAGMSRSYHSSLTLTDYPTAFDEGFAIHLQALAARLSGLPGLRDRVHGIASDDLVELWHGRRDQRLRVAGVRSNQFVWEKLADPALAPAPGDDSHAAGWPALELSTAFSPVRLRNGQQMLASEGAVATLIYRLVFALGGASASEAEALLPAYRAIFGALARMPLDAGTPLAAALFAELAGSDAARAPRIYRAFLSTTFGATVAPEHARDAEALAADGMLGRIEAFGGQLGAMRKAQAALVEDLVAQRRQLTDALGPELWLANPDRKIPAAPWVSEATLPATVNLNTAHEAQLVAHLGISPAEARALVEARRAAHAFASLDAAIQAAGLSGSAAQRLRKQASAAEKLGPHARE